MTQIIGMARSSGRQASGIDHLRQSIADILTTPIGTRLMRRDYGSLLPELIDHPANGANKVRIYAATAGALMKWEPRLRLSRVQINSGERAGQLIIDIEGLYTPPGQSSSVLSLRMPLQMGAAA
ncbi:GPW/gp25 family protein [Polaromonas naphthalenivorans]|uniref:GPW/gp25 family protein n=1 Tax=Polaromonas naphthalenivorans (strain CJ2) TaxID=365044 RepID=A1VSH1_POLNA|nr:GPW/gp25 family protein [Polaromonas naphthalenivorans]ABM38599.1 GPW/gp25 family protein [Polaromonas naphthalenivorans CJ2]